MDTCPKCGGKEFDQGEIVGYPVGFRSIGIYYRSRDFKQGKKIALYSIICLNCGHVEFNIDPKQLK